MKRLILFGGTMGVWKTTNCRELSRLLPHNVLLDGDWCWQMTPFTVSEETQAMVMDNIAHLLGNFLRCSRLENVIFCWVMHEQRIIDDLLARLDTKGVAVCSVSLICTESVLRARLLGDVAAGIRTEDFIERCVCRIPLYENVRSVKIDRTILSPGQTAEKIVDMLDEWIF